MQFVFVSGRTSLDFAGTKKWRHRSNPEELLTGRSSLSEWAQEARMLDTAVRVSADDFTAAIDLREAIYRTVTARLDDRRPKPADVALLNQQARTPPLRPRLLLTGKTRREGSCEQLLASLAADALDLLTGTEIDRTKACANLDCTRLYVDSSRAANRHWCGMSECGNRAKVRAFRARQRAATIRDDI
jgi:predicted RNA-binding Zn ribbon-like protein